MRPTADALCTSDMTVAVISDEEDDLTLYSVGLAAHGVAVHAVATVDDCLTLARQRTGIDVVVLAVVSLHGEGWDACEVLRRAPETSAVPLIVLTASVRADRANRDHARQLGCAAFAAKPCTPAALVSLLMRVASGERSIEQLSDAV